MADFLPSSHELSQVISQATAPAFVLGSVAAFTSILSGRLNSVIDRVRQLNDIDDNDPSRGRLKSDLPRLRRRLILLSSAIRFALASGVCTAALLAASFATAFLRLNHTYGAALLFFLAVVLLGISLVRFSQEVHTGISEADHFR